MESWSDNDNLNADLSRVPDQFKDFVEVIGQLRHPSDGCPWDLKQTHKSLRRYMIEEAYEAVEAMGADDDKHLVEELGDVLLQVVLNAQLMRDRGAGGISEVLQGITEKMIRRHPHVFGDSDESTPEQVTHSWSEIKKHEKGSLENTRILDDFDSKSRPAMIQAVDIGKLACKVDFDWSDPMEVLAQVESELSELKKEILSGNQNKIEEELGDVFFSLAQLSRHLNLDPEVVALGGNNKFIRRFDMMEEKCRNDGIEFNSLTKAQLEELWKIVKKKAYSR